MTIITIRSKFAWLNLGFQLSHDQCATAINEHLIGLVWFLADSSVLANTCWLVSFNKYYGCVSVSLLWSSLWIWAVGMPIGSRPVIGTQALTYRPTFIVHVLYMYILFVKKLQVVFQLSQLLKYRSFTFLICIAYDNRYLWFISAWLYFPLLLLGALSQGGLTILLWLCTCY